MAVRAVLDTNILVAAIRSGLGASRQLLKGALQRQFESVISVPLMLEYEAVLTRQEHLSASNLSAGDVQDILDALASVADPIRLAYLWRPALPDPDDDMVLETAVNGSADLIVTLNRRDFDVAARSFAVKVMSPQEAIRWIGGLS